MALPDEGPCTAWTDWDAVTTCSPVNLDGVAEDVQTAVIAQASDLLYRLSGERYPGVCETTRSLCVACSCGRSSCCCAPRARVDLGSRWPVNDVLDVFVDGEELVAADGDGEHWRVDDWRWLVRLDDEAWPRCADLSDPEAFQVHWTFGRQPPPAGARAAALLGAEIAAACTGGACNLPTRVVTGVDREGVSYVILDAQRFLDEGRTGIYLVDLWLTAEVRGRQAAPGFFDPAACAKRVATGTDAGGS